MSRVWYIHPAENLHTGTASRLGCGVPVRLGVSSAVMFISAWALTLSVQHDWAMREPRYVERAADVSTLSYAQSVIQKAGNMDKTVLEQKIDVVLPWVDGSDAEWQASKERYKETASADKSDSRYRDWENLRFVFRGIENFWPWVNKVFLITCGQRPKWLNTQHERLVLVNHEDYIPKEYLPTFSSHTIELNLHRIEALSEYFIYLNDDFFPICPLQSTDFFRDGLPCDSAAQQNLLSIHVEGDTNIQYIDFTNLGLLNAHFRKRDVTHGHLGKWYGTYLGLHGMIQALVKANQHFFTGFSMHHSAQPFLKSSFKTVWEHYSEYLHRHCLNKFRQNTDVNQWLVRYWQLAENRFSPYSMKQRQVYRVSMQNVDDIVAAIINRQYDIITVNDSPRLSHAEFLQVRQRINQALERLLPRKSMFEV